MNAEQAAALRAPFPPEAIGKIPKGGTWLDYVGHAAVTDRLLSVDPEWTWTPEPEAVSGLPLILQRGNDSVMWIRLTICGVTRLGVGIVATKSFELEKQLISDAIRNAAMRFGVALDLWSKEDLHSDVSPPSPRLADAGSDPSTTRSESAPSAIARENAKTRCVALQGEGVSIADARKQYGDLPIVDSCNAEQLAAFEVMLDALEAALEAPFAEATK